MATASYPHIEHNADGEPTLAGTRIKVRMIALDRIARARDAEEIQRHHPDLSLGQIHSALAYYHDHKDAMDSDIAERRRRVAALPSCGKRRASLRDVASCGNEACSRECPIRPRRPS